MEDSFDNLANDKKQQEVEAPRQNNNGKRNRKCLLGGGLFLAVIAGVVIGLAVHSQSRNSAAAILRTLQHAEGLHMTVIVTGPLSANRRDQRIDVYARNQNTNEDEVDFDLFITTKDYANIRTNYTIVGKRGVYTIEDGNETELSCVAGNRMPPLKQIGHDLLDAEIENQADMALRYGDSCSDGQVNMVYWSGMEFMFCTTEDGELRHVYAPYMIIYIDYLGKGEMEEVEKRLNYVAPEAFDNCDVLDFDRHVPKPEKVQAVDRRLVFDTSITLADTTVNPNTINLALVNYQAATLFHVTYDDMFPTSISADKLLMESAYGLRRLKETNASRGLTANDWTTETVIVHDEIIQMTPKRPCIFVNGWSHKSEDPKIFWGGMYAKSSIPPFCSKAVFLQHESSEPWYSGALASKACDHMLAHEPKDSELFPHQSTDRIVDNVIVISHGVGTLLLGTAISHGQCAFGTTSRWISLNAPLSGSKIMEGIVGMDLTPSLRDWAKSIKGRAGAKLLLHSLVAGVKNKKLRGQLGLWETMLPSSYLPAGVPYAQIIDAVGKNLDYAL